MIKTLNIFFDENFEDRRDRVVKYLKTLQRTMEESERRNQSRTIGFSFSDIAEQLEGVGNEIKTLTGATEEDSEEVEFFGTYEIRDSYTVGSEIVPAYVQGQLTSESDILQKTPVLSGKKGNALNILLNLDSIDSTELKSYLSKASVSAVNAALATEEFTQEMLGVNRTCIVPEATERYIEAAYDKFDDQLPGNELIEAGLPNWDEFINDYINYPRPQVEKFTNPLDTKEMRKKKKLSFSEYMIQKGTFDLLKHPDAASSVEIVKNIHRYKRLNKDSYFGKDNFTKELQQWFDQAQKYTAKESMAKLRHFMFLLQEKICPPKLLQRFVKCFSGVEDCNEFIKFLGAPNVLFILKNIQSIDPRVRLLVNGFNDLPETERTEERFLDLVSETYAGEQDKLCRLLYLGLDYFLDFRIPKASMPKLPTINRYSSFYDQLGKVVLNLLLSALSNLLLGIVDELLKCEDDEFKFIGENFGQRAGKVLQETLVNLTNESSDFMLRSAERYSQLNGGIGGLEQETFNMMIDEHKSLAAERSQMSESERVKAGEYSKLQQAMSEQGFYDDLVSEVGLAETLKLYSGRSSESTLEKVNSNIFSNINLSNEEIKQKFALVGAVYGLSSLEDDLLSSAEELDDITSSANREPLTEEKKAKIKSIIGEIASLSELAETSLLASAFDQLGMPKNVQDAIINSVEGNINPIRIAYDSDIGLYKVATSEEKISKRKVKKVFFKGETISQPTLENGQFTTKQLLVEKTIINPEFEAMISEGHVPLVRRSDGTVRKGKVLGTKIGGYRDDSSPRGKVRKLPNSDDVGKRLKESVGPYTDYSTGDTTVDSPNAYAYKEERQIVFASGIRKSLGLVPETNEIGQEVVMPSFETSIFKDYFRGRGEDAIITEEDARTLESINSLLPARISSLETIKDKIRELESNPNPSTADLEELSFQKELESNRIAIIQSMEQRRDDILGASKLLNNFENFVGKSFYGFQGEISKNVISDSEIVKSFTQDPTSEGVASPLFRVSMANEYGTKLDTSSYVYLYREGPDPIKHTYRHQKNLSINLVRKYAPLYDESECSSPGVDPKKANLYTSQENVFFQIMREYIKKFFKDAGEQLESSFPRSIQTNIFDSKNNDVLKRVNQSTINKMLKEQGNDYDDIYKNIFLVFFNKMRNSTLLQNIDIASIVLPGFASADGTYAGELPIALSYIDLNPTDSKNYKLLNKDPRIFNFDSIKNLVLENYAFFERSGAGEDNLDGERKYDTSLVLAMKSVHPIMVARIYLLEHYLLSLIPSLELDSSLSSVAKRQILNTVQADMAKNYLYTKKFADNTTFIYRKMVELGKVTHTGGEITFAKAFDFFLESEYANVLSNIKRVVLKRAPDCEDISPFDSGSDQESEKTKLSKEQEEKKIKNIFLDSLPLYTFPVNTISPLTNNTTLRIKKSDFSLEGAVRDEERFLQEDSNPEGTYSRQNPETTTSETDAYSQGQLVLQYSVTPQLKRTSEVTEEQLKNYKAKLRLLYVRKQRNPSGPEYTPPQKIADSITSDSFDPFSAEKNYFDSGEFINFVTGDFLNFQDIPEIPRKPQPDDTKYIINTVQLGNNPPDHVYDSQAYQQDLDLWNQEVSRIERLQSERESHDELADSTFYRCYPLATSEGSIKELTGTSALEIYEECKKLENIAEGTRDFVEIKEFINEIQKRTYKPLLEKMRDSEMFDIMFDYCFDIKNIASVAAIKVTQSNANTQLKRMFSDTKAEIRKYLSNIVDVGTDYNKDKLDCASNLPTESSFNFGNFNLDAEFSSSLLKMILTTPLYIYKGWSKTADPHVLLTQTIVDVFETGYIIPKEKQINVEKPFTDPVECVTINSFEYPGDPIWIPGLTQVIAGVVTFTPWIFTGVPFFPTPYGLVYYGVVDPLLQLMESSWRTALVFQNPELAAAISRESGVDFSDIPVCEADRDQLARAQQEQESKQAENEQKLDDNSCPPALDIEFYEGDDC